MQYSGPPQGQPNRTVKGSSRSARRRSRELALQGLYQWLVGGRDAATIESEPLDDDATPKGIDLAHYRELLHGVIAHAVDLRAQLAPHLDRSVEALSPVEHAILLIGSYELGHRVEIPYRVVINEAVELAKTFGGTDGFRYVNGVLDKLAAQVRPAESSAQRS
ncbi:MAG: transcription antitermination factor NusB [Burkholderiaceae bacterium]